MNKQEWLVSQGRDYLEGLYAGLPFSAASDAVVAEKINGGRGKAVLVTANVVGKARLDFGMREKASARRSREEVISKALAADQVVAILPSPVPAQSELPIPSRDHHHGDPLWALVGQFNTLNGYLAEIRNILAGAAGRIVVESGKASPAIIDLAAVADAALEEFRHTASPVLLTIFRLRAVSPGLTAQEAKSVVDAAVARKQDSYPKAVEG